MRVLRFSGLLALILIILIIIILLPLLLMAAIIIAIIGAIVSLPLAFRRKNKKKGPVIIDAEYRIKEPNSKP